MLTYQRCDDCEFLSKESYHCWQKNGGGKIEEFPVARCQLCGATYIINETPDSPPYKKELQVWLCDNCSIVLPIAEVEDKELWEGISGICPNCSISYRIEGFLVISVPLSPCDKTWSSSPY